MPEGALSDVCEAVVGQQEALLVCLAWTATAQAADPSATVTIPTPDWDSVDGPWLSADVPIIRKHLQAREAELVHALTRAGLGHRTPDGLRVELPTGTRPAAAVEAIQDMWRRTKVAAVSLVEAHGTPQQQQRLHAARQQAPSGTPLIVVASLPAPTRRPGLGVLGGPRPTTAQTVGGVGRPAVLVVDDEPDVVETLALYIRNVAPNVEVLTAGSGPEALEALSDRPVALILSDLRMPGMDGINFLQRARTLKPQARRFLITAYPGPEVEQRAKNEAGVESVIRKPMAMQGLRTMLREIGQTPAAT